MTVQPPDGNRSFLVRLAATVGVAVLLLYLVKIWYVDPARERPVTGTQPPTVHIPTQAGPAPQAPTPAPQETGPIVQWQDSARYVGQHVTVEGKIVGTHNSGKACFLNFHPDYKRHFTAVIFASAFGKFPPNPERHYSGKRVRVTGLVKDYQGKPEIVLNDPSQIEVVE